MYIEREDQLSIEIYLIITSYIQICSSIIIDHQVCGGLIYKESMLNFLKCLQIENDRFFVYVVKIYLILGDSKFTIVGICKNVLWIKLIQSPP